METSKDPIRVRVARMNAEVIGKTNFQTNNLLSRECLLDAFQALYDECTIENLRKTDTNIAHFAERFKSSLKQVKQLRINKSDFEVKNVIGRGHFGEVHVVKEKQTGDIYAMKIIRKFDNEIKRTSFNEERDIMAFSQSPWLTSLQYAFQDSTYLFFVMDYHPGGDLLGLLHRQGGSIPESAATFYIAELVLALEDLHKMGYVHRDIKPDNILLDRCGHIKLADFGSAAILDKNELVSVGPPVGTPDYIAPEVLQTLDNKTSKNSSYGVSCDFWSLGVLAYELTIGNTPFTGQNTTTVYSKIMNFKNNLKFPPDILLTQAYVMFIKGLITDVKTRFNRQQIKTHSVFKTINFDTLRDQVPPFVPKISSVDDTSHFNDIQPKRKSLSVENFKKRTQFSGRNLPFIGFSYTNDFDCFDANFERKILAKDEIVQNLKNEIDNLRTQLMKNNECHSKKEELDKRLEEKARGLENLETLRDKLERDLANSIAENTALKRTLDLERKDRIDLETKALNLIKSAKLKWEVSEKNKVDALVLESEQLKEKIVQLTNTNELLNEQLQHALKQQDKQKQSLEKVQNFSRHSVVGLESRLEKVTVETQNTISLMKSQLSEERHQKTILEQKLEKHVKESHSLTKKLESSKKQYEDLQSHITEAEKLNKKLIEKVDLLEDQVKQLDICKNDTEHLQELFDNSQRTIKEFENKVLRLQSEKMALEKKLIEMEQSIKKAVKTSIDNKILQLESQLSQEKENNNSLKKRLEESDNLQTENQELKELRTKYWRMEKDFGNCKIDKRILERELKDAQKEITELNDKIKTLSDSLTQNKQSNEMALLELNNINESVTLDLMKTKDACKNLEDKFLLEKKKSDEMSAIIKELKNIIGLKDEEISNFISEINHLKKENISCDSEIKMVEKEKYNLSNVIDELNKEKMEIHNELEKSKREIQNTTLNLEALREACTLLENQVIEYEKIITTFEMKESTINENTEKLINDLCKAKQEIQDAKKLVNEEKSLKLLAETKVKRLTEDNECLLNECTAYKKQCMEYKEYSLGVSDELTIAEEKITELKINLKSQERQIESFVSENRVLKEEISSYITQIAHLKESNYKYNHQIKDIKANEQFLSKQILEMERIIQEKENYFKERELKYDSTIQQQIKLIDYLQTRIDELSHKKKSITDILFGHSKKENIPPPTLVKNYKDLEIQLMKEQQMNKHLKEEILDLKSSSFKLERHKSEIVSPTRRKAILEIVNSPKNHLLKKGSLQRMHHNIPHRFDSKLCTMPSKCRHCTNPLSVGRNICVCKECHISVHTNCMNLVPRTCGLPDALVNHYRDNMNETKPDKVEVANINPENIRSEGWIKILGKTNKWERCYAYLNENTLNIFSQPIDSKTSELIQAIELKENNQECKLKQDLTQSELDISVVKSDLPFILKIEAVQSTKNFIFMCPSYQEKTKWVEVRDETSFGIKVITRLNSNKNTFLALQKILNEDVDRYQLESVLKIPDEMHVNCIVSLTDSVKVLGTEKGLYSHYNNSLLHIEGVEKVRSISVVPWVNVVLMLVDEESSLISCDLNHLINLAQCAPCAKPKLKFNYINVKNLNGFHILQVSQHSNQQKLCVATSKQLIILNYDLETDDFIPIRILDTAKPISCILFTEHSLIVGADKFFEVDLISFQAEEFLDASDVKLKQALKCYKLGSFPLAVVQVSSKSPKEFLISFNEFSIFVDEYGRASREVEIKSSYLPVAVHFSKPYLYLVQFAAIEIIKITGDTCNSTTENSESIRIELDKVRFLGSCNRGIFIYYSNEIKFVDAKNILDSDTSTVISEVSENGNNSEDRFSFTSSMVQSLDGHTSENECEQKKVKFTDL